MLNERRQVVESITNQLHEGEVAVEAALTALATLAISLPAARNHINISPVAGQQAFDSLGAAIAGIVAVRGHMVATHNHLEAVRAQFRLPIVNTGGGAEKPASATLPAPVTLVREAAAA